MDMVNELLGKQYNIAKANRTDRKVQNLAWKKRVSAQDLRNRRIRRYFVCRLKRSEARDFSHVRFTKIKYSVILSTYHGKQIKLSVIVRQLRRGGENDGQ